MKFRRDGIPFMVRVLILMGMALFIRAGAAGIALSSGAVIVDRIVAVVNDDIITLNDLNRELEPYLTRIKSMGYSPEQQADVVAKLQKDILDRLIEEKLTDQQIRRAGLEVSDEEVDRAVAKVKEKNFYSDADFEKALTAEGMSLDEYRRNLKAQILRSRLVNREVKSKIVVTEQDVKNYYESHPEAYGGEQKYHLRNIIMRLSGSADESEKRAVLKRMAAVLEKFENGEPFAELARAYSESNLAAEGGDLGLFELEALAPQLQEALKGLRTGEITPVLETDQGYQLFYVQDIKVIPGRSLEEVAPAIEEKLYAEIVEKRFKQWLDDLRRRSHVKLVE